LQEYNKGFADIYNAKWTGFAQQVAPLILSFYESKPIRKENNSILDLCCGTGQLSLHFLEKGFRVVGLDASEPMLVHARRNAAQYVASGMADFIQGDASNFRLDERFGLVVSTFDSMNHLEDETELRSCFQCVNVVCDGSFIFDMNTREGLKRWNSIHVDESSGEDLIITRGIFDSQSDKAWTRISGFVRQDDGLYERFEQTAYNTVFELEKVKVLLLEVGWKKVHFALAKDLNTPIDEPEKESRVFIVAGR
jgi:SAM-dependent methyltransferase